MTLTDLACYQTVFNRFPAASCLVDTTNFLFLSTNSAFECGLGHQPGQWKCGSVFDILDDENSKISCKRMFSSHSEHSIDFLLFIIGNMGGK